MINKTYGELSMKIKKCISILLATSFIFLAGIAVWLGTGMLAQITDVEAEWSEVSVEDSYDINSEFSIPARDVEISGEKVRAEGILVYPDGTATVKSPSLLDQAGIYFVRWSAEVNGQPYAEEKNFVVYNSVLSHGTDTTVEYGTPVTAETEGIEAVKREIPSLKDALYTGTLPAAPREEPAALEYMKEGLKTPSAVQYVARAGHISHYTGAFRILKVILSYEYLWIQIRVKGGAYGCMSGFGVYGDSYLVSYRDPNLKETNQVFENTADYVEHFDATDRDMTKYVIGTISEMDTPLTPAAAGNRSMSAWLTHTTLEDLQRTRDQVLEATPADIRGLASGIRELLDEGSLCAIGNENRIENEKEMFDRTWNLFHTAEA